LHGHLYARLFSAVSEWRAGRRITRALQASQVFGGRGQLVLPRRCRGTHGGVAQIRDDLISRVAVKEVMGEGLRVHAARQPQTLFFVLTKILNGSC
jgi:hypothetical protein